MNIWYFLNIFVASYALYKVLTAPYINAPIVFGLLGLFFVLFNWTRHAVFSTIRDSKVRSQKIKFAQFSKRIYPFHKWVGTTALVLIGIHALLIINRYGLYLPNKKILTGLLAGITLVALVLSGWIRWYKTTPMKRYVHWGLGFLIFFMVIFHLLF